MRNKMILMQLAFISCILFIPFVNAWSNDSEQSCKPLPKDEQISALGYMLGSCLSDVKSLVKVKGFTIVEEKNDPLFEKEPLPFLKSFKSNFTDAVLPFKDDLYTSLGPPIDITLYFYNNVLYEVMIDFSYSFHDDKQKEEDATSIIFNKISERTGVKPVIDKNGVTWENNRLKVHMLPGGSMFYINYTHTLLEKRLEQDKKIFLENRRINEQENTHGF